MQEHRSWLIEFVIPESIEQCGDRMISGGEPSLQARQ